MYLPASSLDEVDMTWHTASGLILSLTLPGHYWITLTIHAIKLALGKGVAAPFIAARTRRACCTVFMRYGASHPPSLVMP